MSDLFLCVYTGRHELIVSDFSFSSPSERISGSASFCHLTLFVCPRQSGHRDEWLLCQVVLPVWIYAGVVQGRPDRESETPFLKGPSMSSLKHFFTERLM